MSSQKKEISIKAKYAFYQKAVQGTEIELKNHVKIYRDIFHNPPYRLREDFSGTFLFCCEWIKSSSKRSAIAVDIDPEPLEYGKRYNLKQLSSEEKKRLSIIQDDVRIITDERSQIISASNFSFNVFKKKKDLKTYFSAALNSLDKNGILILETVGGKEFTKAPNSEERECTKTNKKGEEIPWFTYYWSTHRYDPKTKNGLWSIDVKLKKSNTKTTIFEYDWRIWSLTEIKQLLKSVGFRDIIVYQLNPENFQYQRIQSHPKDPCWICKVVGVK